jgi:hypothetical protein
MPLVDWSNVLPAGALVTFSSLRVPDQRDSLDDDIAEITFDGWFIDVEWVDREKRYYVTMFRGEFENYRSRIPCKTPHEVLETVRGLIDERNARSHSYSAPITYASELKIPAASDSGLRLVECK